MLELDFGEVVRIWEAAGGKDTGGIIRWFHPEVTTRWVEEEITVEQVGELRFIGGDPGSRWEVLSSGKYKVKEAVSGFPGDPAFRWQPAWRLVTIRDPESSERTIIDGNTRALELAAAVSRGDIRADARLTLLTGDLNLLIVRIAKTASSLWR